MRAWAGTEMTRQAALDASVQLNTVDKVKQRFLLHELIRLGVSRSADLGLLQQVLCHSRSLDRSHPPLVASPNHSL